MIHRAKMMEQQKLLRARLRQEGLKPEHGGPVRLADLVEIDGAAFDVLRQRGIAYFRAGKIEACRAVFEMLLALGDYSPPVFFILARCAELLGDPKRAKGYFWIGWELVDGDREDGVALKNAALRWGSHLLPYSTENGEAG